MQLQQVFENANPANPEQTYEAFKHVMGDLTVIDYDVHPNSPRRYRPAYLDDPEFKCNFESVKERPLHPRKIQGPKDWGKAPS